MSWLLDLNDAQIGLYEGQNNRYREPAVTVWADNQWHYGYDAWRQIKLHPQQASNLYMERLSAEPLPRSISNAKNYADLTYQHLLQLHEHSQAQPLTAAIAGNVSADQLGVLLGIAQQAQVNLVRFCDTALLAAGNASFVQDELWVIDVQLHQLVLTKVVHDTQDGVDQLVRDQVDVINRAGLANLLDGWSNVVADHFVKATRFDPLHAADTEQQLHNQLLNWATMPDAAQELAVEIEQGGNQRRAEIDIRLLAEKTHQRASALATRLPAQAPVALTSRCAALPGLADALGDRNVQILPDNAVVEGYLALAAAGHMPPDGPIVHLTRVPYLGQRVSSPVAENNPATTAMPTHALHGNAAISLAQLRQQFPNELDKHNLVCGAHLTLGDKDYQLIQVIG